MAPSFLICAGERRRRVFAGVLSESGQTKYSGFGFWLGQRIRLLAMSRFTGNPLVRC